MALMSRCLKPAVLQRTLRPWQFARRSQRKRCKRAIDGRSALNTANEGGIPPPLLDATWLQQQSAVMGSASAILGPLCDGQHSSHDVLHYAAPVHLQLGFLHLETCWWVPLLFAVAGVILGVSHPVLDSWQQQRGGQQPRCGTDPPWTFVLAAITLFVLQYAASGALEGGLLGQTLGGGLPTLDVVLAAAAVATWWAFDATPQGLAMACLTAVAGPAVEVALINAPHLYSYTHPAVLGVPTWIAWVYFAGAPAVGSLGRKVSSSLVRRRQAAEST